MLRRLFFVIPLALLFGCSTDQPEVMEPEPLSFAEQIARSQVYADFMASGASFAPEDLEIHDLSEYGLGRGSIAIAETPLGVASILYTGDQEDIGEIQGYLVSARREGIVVHISLRSPDASQSIDLGFTEAQGLVTASRQARTSLQGGDFDWSELFDCIEVQVLDFPTWANVTCGASIFLCAVGNPVGCFASAVCAVVYISPCVYAQLDGMQ